MRGVRILGTRLGIIDVTVGIAMTRGTIISIMVTPSTMAGIIPGITILGMMAGIILTIAGAGTIPMLMAAGMVVGIVPTIMVVFPRDLLFTVSHLVGISDQNPVVADLALVPVPRRVADVPRLAPVAATRIAIVHHRRVQQEVTMVVVAAHRSAPAALVAVVTVVPRLRRQAAAALEAAEDLFRLVEVRAPQVEAVASDVIVNCKGIS